MWASSRPREGSAGLTSGRRRQRGQSLVEFALVAPVLLLLFSGVLDLGRAFYYQVSATDAARDGVRLAAGNYGGHGPDLATICSEITQDLSAVPSVSCVTSSHAPPYHSGVDFAQPASGTAVAVIYCGSAAACGAYSGAPQHYDLAVQVNYAFGLLTPFISQIAGGGTIQMADAAQMVGNW